MMKRQPFATLIDPKILKWLKQKSKESGMKVYAIVEEALLDMKRKRIEK